MEVRWLKREEKVESTIPSAFSIDNPVASTCKISRSTCSEASFEEADMSSDQTRMISAAQEYKMHKPLNATSTSPIPTQHPYLWTSHRALLQRCPPLPAPQPQQQLPPVAVNAQVWDEPFYTADV